MLAWWAFSHYHSLMADLNEWLDMLKPFTQGDQPVIPAEIVDGIASEWQHHSTVLDGASVRLSEVSAANAAKDAEIAQLKAQNYDLTIQLPGFNNGPNTKEPRTQNDPETGISGLFQKRTK